MRRLLLVAIGLSAIHGACCAFTAALAQEPAQIKREILALYDGGQESDDVNFTRIHRFAELPLNHLGFTLEFRDVRGKLPDPADVERYRAVLTWFVGAVPDPDAYLAWAVQISRRNVRYVVLGDIGVAVGPTNLSAVNQLLAPAGLRHTGDLIAPTSTTRVVQEDPDLVEFECQLDPVLPGYPVIDITAADTRVGLMLETPKYERSRQTAVVAVGPRGGYAALNYEFCHPRSPLYQGQWFINPFAFFRAALGAEEFPIPDTTTVSGRRVYFSLLDGEGWNRPSKIEGYRQAGTSAADVVRRELIRQFRNLPTTVDLQEDELPKSGRSALQARQATQELLTSSPVDLSKHHLRASMSRFDAEHPSISNLSPLTSFGIQRTVNTALSSETANGEDGFVALEQSVTNTDAPRRLKPFNLNYHAYAGEHPAMLQSIKRQLQVASTAPLTPLSANRYAAIVDGFFSARIDRISDHAWRIRDRGALQTVRFDDAVGSDVMLRSSTGVIGQRHIGAALYVSLDEAVEPAIVVLGPSSKSPSIRLSLNESRWLISNVDSKECALRFEAQGYGQGEFAWSDAAPGRYLITVAQSDHEFWRQNVEADDDRKLRFVLPIEATDPVTVNVTCNHSDQP